MSESTRLRAQTEITHKRKLRSQKSNLLSQTQSSFSELDKGEREKAHLLAFFENYRSPDVLIFNDSSFPIVNNNIKGSTE